MVSRRFPLILLAVCLLALPVFGQSQSASKPKPRVVVVGVNGMEWDIIRPLLVKGELPNLARVFLTCRIWAMKGWRLSIALNVASSLG